MESECSKCHVIGTLAAANVSRKTNKRLYRSWCVLCEKQRKDEWRNRNKQHHNEKGANWVKANPEKRKETASRWRDANKEKQKLAKTNWLKLNAARSRAYVNSRRTMQRKATPVWLSEWDLFLLSELYHLAQLRNQQVDHIVPLQGKQVCGLHVPWNLQLLSAKENYRKSNKWMIDTL